MSNIYFYCCEGDIGSLPIIDQRWSSLEETHQLETSTLCIRQEEPYVAVLDQAVRSPLELPWIIPMADFDDELDATSTPQKSQTGRDDSFGLETRGSGSKGGSASKVCPMSECNAEKKGGSKFCRKHHQLYENMKNQAGSQGEEQKKKILDKMSNHQTCCDAVLAFQVDNVGVQEHRHKTLINWVEWNSKYGITLSESELDRVKPMEKLEFLIREKTQFGRTQEQADADWSRFEKRGYQSDFKGRDGCIRLWLPFEEYQDSTRAKFITGESVEGSERKKNPSEHFKAAFRGHVDDKFAVPHGITHGHSFFRKNGNDGVTSHEDAEDLQRIDEDRDEENGSKRAPPSKISSAAKSARTSSRTDDLENTDSEDDIANSKKKKGAQKRRKVNVLDARTAFFTKASKDFNAKRTPFCWAVGLPSQFCVPIVGSRLQVFGFVTESC